jgi:flagellar hook-associated protein 2
MTGMRIGGLASGMDIDQIIGDLMKAERIPLDKLFTKKTTFEWQRDSYRSVNTKMKSFDDYLFNNFTLSSNFNKKTVTSSNEAAVAATASSSAVGSLTIDSVTSLAKNAIGVSGGLTFTVGKDATSNLSESLGMTAGEQTFNLNVYENGAMKVKSIKFDPATTSLNQLVSKVNSSDAGVTMFFDEVSKKISISSKSGGDNSAGAEVIAADLATQDFFGKLGFTADNVNLATGGTNAVLSVNGMSITRTSNQFAINGFTVNLKSETTAATTLTANSDVNSMVDKVKEFVTKYNELITGMNDQLKEKKYRDFPPLTDEQRKDMSETEQELWDEKARSGLLKNDSIMRSGLGEMRNSLYGRVDGIGDNMIDTLAEMGITTSSTYSDGGKLVINEDKLRKALTDNPEQVVSTLSQSGSKTATEDTRGIVQRLRESMKDFTSDIEKRAGKASSTDQQYTIGKNLIDTNDRISSFQRRLEDTEARYWRQFTAMEKAISQANQQSAMLMGQTGG